MILTCEQVTLRKESRVEPRVSVILDRAEVLLSILAHQQCDSVFLRSSRKHYHPFFLTGHRVMEVKSQRTEGIRKYLYDTLTRFADSCKSETRQELLFVALECKDEPEKYEVFWFSTHPSVGPTIISKSRNPSASDLRAQCYRALKS